MEDNPQGSAPQTPPSSPPPSTPPPPTEQPSQVSSNRTIMLVLSYLGILALVPLLVEKEDSEVQWHAKHGIILMATWIILSIAFMILSSVPAVGVIFGCAVGPLLWLVAMVVHIICIVQAVNGKRFKLPVVSDFVDQWK